ncbi:DUF1992 domain-containing protein [Arthrobacter sp. zg-Y1143]|uniref:DnaJ family domain-containing protein n=1 Tax=Arthrobacter sp. zg-Y1143 TaxID=3049065 RepID=UPI0024C3F0B5|nr:DUF1992 domain-containing protein [Arthrobacter sp. zg-Y1143]MDK1326333.1 DUF1992 domain-containing protein [Arthrobacter sp. zg-Y1143]
MDGRGVEQYRRRMERAAQLRAAGAGGGLDPEDVEQAAAEEELQHKRRQVDDAARADYLVRDAMARGDFDNLKYAGKPIPGLGDGHDPDWWIKGVLQRENVTGLGPAAILLRTEDAELDARLDTRWSERQVREILEDFNTRVINARRQLEGGPPVVTRTRDVEQEILRWRERKAAAAAAEEAQKEAAAPEAERRRWNRWKRRR